MKLNSEVDRALYLSEIRNSMKARQTMTADSVVKKAIASDDLDKGDENSALKALNEGVIKLIRHKQLHKVCSMLLSMFSVFLTGFPRFVQQILAAQCGIFAGWKFVFSSLCFDKKVQRRL